MSSIISLVIVFKLEHAFESRIKAFFHSCFHNKDMEVYPWSQVEGLR